MLWAQADLLLKRFPHDVTPFHVWLEQQPKQRVVGRCCSIPWCPVAQYLRETIPQVTDITVTARGIRIDAIDEYGTYTIKTRVRGSWLLGFLGRVDGYANKPGQERPVTAEEALMVLYPWLIGDKEVF